MTNHTALCRVWDKKLACLGKPTLKSAVGGLEAPISWHLSEDAPGGDLSPATLPFQGLSALIGREYEELGWESSEPGGPLPKGVLGSSAASLRRPGIHAPSPQSLLG